MPYGAIIQGIMSAIGTGIATNQISKARGGYEAQLGKTKRVEPIREPNPQMFDWRNALMSAFGANQETQPGRYADASRQNAFNLGQAKKMYSGIQPYFNEINEQTGRNALSFGRGELPADLLASLNRSAASSGIQNGFSGGSASGTPGSAGQSSLLRRLGLTSLDLMQRGSQMGMQANRFATSATPQLANTEAQTINPLALMGFEEGNTNRLNESNRYWNGLQNQAEWDNVATLNRANEMIANGKLGARLAEAKMWQEMGNSGGKSAGAATTGFMGGGA